MYWEHRISDFRELISEDESKWLESHLNIAAYLQTNPIFAEFVPSIPFYEWADTPDIDEANYMLDEVWDFCDDNAIWIEL